MDPQQYPPSEFPPSAQYPQQYGQQPQQYPQQSGYSQYPQPPQAYPPQAYPPQTSPPPPHGSQPYSPQPYASQQPYATQQPQPPPYLAASNSAEARQAVSDRGKRDIIFGAIWLAVGLGITCFTFAYFNGLAGIVAWGPAIYGIYKIIKGIVTLNRR